MVAKAERIDEFILQRIFGVWEVTRAVAVPFVSEFTEEQLEARKGKQFLYSEDLVISYGGNYTDQSLEHPSYEIIFFPADELGPSYRISESDLELDTDTIIRIRVFSDENYNHLWRTAGHMFIKDVETLFYWDGAFFEMKRVEH